MTITMQDQCKNEYLADNTITIRLGLSKTLFTGEQISTLVQIQHGKLSASDKLAQCSMTGCQGSGTALNYLFLL